MVSALAWLESMESEVLVYRMVGDLFESESGKLAGILHDARMVGARGVVLDLSETNVNGNGAKALCILRGDLKNIPLRIVKPPLTLSNHLHQFGVKDLFQFSHSIEDAIAELTRLT